MKFFNAKLFGALIVGGLIVGGFYYANEQKMNQLPALGITKHPGGGFTFSLDEKPYVVRGVCYSPIPVGKDYEYDFWGDPGKPWITDGKLMEDMGVNAVRLYRLGENSKDVKKVINDLYRKNNIRTFAGHYLGFWDWPPANYANAGFKKKIKTQVVEMVRTYKDSPGIIGWILGNENNYSFDRNLRSWSNEELDAMTDPKQKHRAMAEMYYAFVNELAIAVKEVDPTRPVIMGVGEVKSLHIAKDITPDVDILGMIAYRGATFGNMFRQIKQNYDKPVLLTEYGADRYNAYTQEEDEKSQARFLELQWKDIERNSTIRNDKGNCIGGIIFEWSDEWWKANENLSHTWAIHDKSAQWSHSSYYYDYEASGHMNINEEWWGVVGLKPRPANLENAIDKRELKDGYYVMQDLWVDNVRQPDINLLKSIAPMTTQNKTDANSVTSNVQYNATNSESNAAMSSAAEAAAKSASANSSIASSSTQAANASSSGNAAQLNSSTASQTSRSTNSTSSANSMNSSGSTAVLNSPVNEPVVIQSNRNGGHSLYRDEELSVVKGVVYQPFGIGQGPGNPFWNTGLTPWNEDIELLKDMGANAVRIYTDAKYASAEQDVIKLFDKNGIQTYLGIDYLTSASSSSSAKSKALSIVKEYKSNPGIAAWILGNEDESTYTLNNSIWSTEHAYYVWVNDLANEIKTIDSTRPVILNIGNTKNLKVASGITPNIDVLGVTVDGDESLNQLFSRTSEIYNQAILVLRFGSDRYNVISSAEDESAQAKVIAKQWSHIIQHSSFYQKAGHVVGAFVHEWTDQWWRAAPTSKLSWNVQDVSAQHVERTFEYDYESNSIKNVNDEWWGLVGLEKTAAGIVDKRIPKKAYYVLMGQWNTELITCAV